MTFIPQNQFEQSLLKAQSDPSHRPQFYKDFAAATLFVIQEDVEGTGHKTFEAGSSFTVRPVEWNGKSYLPVFSSLERLSDFIQGKTGYIEINATDFMKLVSGANLLLNPGSDCGKEFFADEVMAILDGSIWKGGESYRVEKDTQVMIGRPKKYPVELANALTRYFKDKKEVKKAYIAQFFNPDKDQRPHTLVAVEVTGNWDAVWNGAAIATKGVPVFDPPVDYIQLTEASGLWGHFRKSKPFYEKKLFGIFG